MMADKQGIGDQGSGIPSNVQPQGGTGQPNPNEPVTRVELENLRREFQETSRRQAQSYSMQAEGRIDKKIQKKLAEYDAGIATMKSIGQSPTDEAIEQGRQKIITSAYLDQPQNQNQPGTQSAGYEPRIEQQPGAATPETEILNNAAGKILKLYGVEALAKEDQEAAMVRFGSSTEFLDTFEEAVAAKAKRMGIGTNPATRISTLGGSGSSTLAIEEQYKKELKALPRGANSALARIRLRDKYRKLGYESPD
jgi:hypothetical protein